MKNLFKGCTGYPVSWTDDQVRYAHRTISMHDQLVECLIGMVEQFADFDGDTGELKPDQFTIVNTAIALINMAEESN